MCLILGGLFQYGERVLIRNYKAGFCLSVDFPGGFRLRNPRVVRDKRIPLVKTIHSVGVVCRRIISFAYCRC